MIDRNALRTAVSAGLGNAFASISGVEYCQYVALAVLAVSTGTYGAALALGRQRLLGTVLGSMLLLIGYEGLQHLPMPLAIAITLGALRLLGGLLQLQVGYKVGGMIIVMGWLVHEGGLATWIPIRFFWTAFGVLIALLGLRLFWPARSLDLSFRQLADLLAELQRCYRDLAARVDPADADPAKGDQDPGTTAHPGRPAVGMERYRALRNRLLVIRKQRPALLLELGSMPERHPGTQLMASFDAAASRLITVVGGLVREAPSTHNPAAVQRLHRAEAELLQAMAVQLGHWEQQLRGARGLPEAPAPGLQLPRSWLELNHELNDPGANTASLERLQRLASRLLLCRQAALAIRSAEMEWKAIRSRS